MTDPRFMIVKFTMPPYPETMGLFLLRLFPALLPVVLLQLTPTIALAQGSVIPPCIDGDGKISGGTENNTCRNTLPKCSDLLAGYKTKVAENLALKIHGYLQKQADIDTAKTSAETLVSTPLPIKVCSVVGPTIKLPPGNASLGFRSRNIGGTYANGSKTNFTNEDCGAPASYRLPTSVGARQIVFDFNGPAWNTISAQILGALPYEIRAEYFKFFQNISKPSEIDAKLVDPELLQLKGKFQLAQAANQEYYSNLPAESKAVCSKPEYTNLNERCRGGNPAISFGMDEPGIRTCVLSQTMLTLNQGSVQSMIERQIMVNAQTAFKNHFYNQLMRTDNASLMSKLLAHAEDDTSWWDCVWKGWSNGQAKCAAEIVSGVMGDGNYRIYDAGEANWTTDSASCWTVEVFGWFGSFFDFFCDPVGVKYYGLTLNDSPGVFTQDPRYRKYYPGRTEGSGVSAIVEYIIRHDICAQTNKYADSPMCSESVIPNRITQLNGKEIKW